MSVSSVESHSRVDQARFFDFILTQTALNGHAPYDLIERVIAQSIDKVKELNVNARISNIALNIDGRLCFVQIYTERRNGFVAAQSQFGTDPTEYIVQVRFPYGLEVGVGGQRILIPRGDFQTILRPYLGGPDQVKDDVIYDTKHDDLILGDGVRKALVGNQLYFYCTDNEAPQLVIDYHEYIGSGYSKVVSFKEYWTLSDYDKRLKMNGVYSLFYTNAQTSPANLLRMHSDYVGTTELQLTRAQAAHRDYANVVFESSDPAFSQPDPDPSDNYDEFNHQQRQDRYTQLLERMNTQMRDSVFGQQSLSNLQAMPADVGYVLNLSIINGVTLLRDYGLPVIRLRDYQLSLLQHCTQFAKQVSDRGLRGSSGSIDMGVGAGKTFFTYTLLQELNDAIKQGRLHLPAPYCMAPNEAVASVTAKTINRQGIKTGTAATLITKPEHIPSVETLNAYQRISDVALVAGARVDKYIQVGLQQIILNYCRTHQLHPYTTLNWLYGKLEFKLFKESIDPNRLLLMVEGQKSLMKQTGMLGLEALRNLSEQLTAIQKGFEDVVQTRGSVFHSSYSVFIEASRLPRMNYDQAITFNAAIYDKYHISYQNKSYFLSNAINFSTISPSQLYDFLKARYKSDPRKIRDALVKIACLNDLEAAILLANSGGLGNTYSKQQMAEQIERLLPKAYQALSELIHKTPEERSLWEDVTIYRYLNELLVTVPDALSVKQSKTYLSQSESRMLGHVLRHHLNLIEVLQQSIAAELAAIPKISEQDRAILEPYDLPSDGNILDVAHHMAGIMALRASYNADLRHLQIKHIPVFTVDGFVAYIEALAGLEGAPVVSMSQCLGLYSINTTAQVITFKDIAQRLKSLLRTIMVADEVHKAEFEWLFNEQHPLYQRINAVTQKYLGQLFNQVLPNRIGMSGTINEVATRAFPGRSLYSLSIQKMIQSGITKAISMDTYALCPDDVSAQDEAHTSWFSQKIVMNYLEDAHKVSSVSRALLFSKTPNEALNQAIQAEFSEQQRLAFKDYLFALYLEYVLSKSNSPKEGSDLIGLQNKLFFTHAERLSDIQALIRDEMGGALLMSLARVSPDTLTQADASLFMRQKMPHPALQKGLVEIICTYKNNVDASERAIDALSGTVPCDALITTDRQVLETGTAMLMLGTDAERTGYSHEPVGIILDVPSNIKNMLLVNRLLAALNTAPQPDELFASLHQLIEDTYSYDEKNQAGGRALRTPMGRARLIEYASNINAFLPSDAHVPLQLLRVETSFGDIFTAHEHVSKAARASIECNRTLIQLLHACGPGLSLVQANDAVQRQLAQKLSNPVTGDQYRAYIQERLPLAWAMKYSPECAAEYFRTRDISKLPSVQCALGVEVPESVSDIESVWSNDDVEVAILRDQWSLSLAMHYVLNIVIAIVILICAIIVLSAVWNGLSVSMIGLGIVTVQSSPIIIASVAAVGSVSGAVGAYRSGFFTACSAANREEGGDIPRLT